MESCDTTASASDPPICFLLAAEAVQWASAEAAIPDLAQWSTYLGGPWRAIDLPLTRDQAEEILGEILVRIGGRWQDVITLRGL